MEFLYKHIYRVHKIVRKNTLIWRSITLIYFIWKILIKNKSFVFWILINQLFLVWPFKFHFHHSFLLDKSEKIHSVINLSIWPFFFKKTAFLVEKVWGKRVQKKNWLVWQKKIFWAKLKIEWLKNRVLWSVQGCSKILFKSNSKNICNESNLSKFLTPLIHQRKTEQGFS